jgi:hypothetical protein
MGQSIPLVVDQLQWSGKPALPSAKLHCNHQKGNSPFLNISSPHQAEDD